MGKVPDEIGNQTNCRDPENIAHYMFEQAVLMRKWLLCNSTHFMPQGRLFSKTKNILETAVLDMVAN